MDQDTSAHEKNAHQDKKGGDGIQKPSRSYVIAAILLVIAVIIVNIIENRLEETSTESVQTESDDRIIVTIDDGSEKSDLQINLENLVEGYGLDLFENLDQAGTIINSTQGKPTAGIGSEHLIANVVASDSDYMVYFATKSHNPSTEKLFNGIYHYNTQSNRWQRLYKNTFETNDGITPYLRVLGRTGKYLVLLKDLQENSPGPCANFWLMGEEEGFGLMLMDLEDPYGGFIDFTLPESLREEAKQKEQSCQASL
jgi:hypothetical protein